MNKYITFCAKSKLYRLLVSSNSQLEENSQQYRAVKLSASRGGSFEISFVFSIDRQNDIIISHAPMVVCDHFTLRLLKNGSVDFSYKDNEFIITRDTNVILAHA